MSTPYKNLLKPLLFSISTLALAGNAMAGNLTATSISDNADQLANDDFIKYNSYFTGLQNISDGVTTKTPAHGLYSTTQAGTNPVTPPQYTMYLDFAPQSHQLVTAIQVWANAGSIMSDGELRSFDLEVDYLDSSNVQQTLSMPGVNIGDTTGITDVKTVTLMQNGSPVQLKGVSQIRMSNLDDQSTGEIAIREVQAVYTTPTVELVTVKSLSSGNRTPREGDQVQFSIEVTNHGTGTSTNVRLADKMPAGITLTSVGNPSGTTYDSSNGRWVIGSLGPGASSTLTLTGTVDAGTKGQTITNTTIAALGNGNDNSNTIGDILSQSVTIANPGLTVEKVADKTEDVGAGDTITYTYTVTNTGNVPIDNVTFSDSHNASGPAPTATNEQLVQDNNNSGDSTDSTSDGFWDVLAPGDVVSFTGTYTVTQDDIEHLQ